MLIPSMAAIAIKRAKWRCSCLRVVHLKFLFRIDWDPVLRIPSLSRLRGSGCRLFLPFRFDFTEYIIDFGEEVVFFWGWRRRWNWFRRRLRTLIQFLPGRLRQPKSHEQRHSRNRRMTLSHRTARDRRLPVWSTTNGRVFSTAIATENLHRPSTFGGHGEDETLVEIECRHLSSSALRFGSFSLFLTARF
jgi:hypothetical protein